MPPILQKSVLATLAYYDALDYPLTVGEVFKFLINPERIGDSYLQPENPNGVSQKMRCGQRLPAPHSRLHLETVLNYLGILVENKKLEEKNGFYFLPGRAELYEKRIEKNKISEQKWKKARRYLFLSQALPYVEAIFASGSLALGHTDEESDLDVLVVARKGRIWLARVLLSLAMSLLGVRRKNKERTAPDKICLNHYITTDSLKIPFESLYNAQSYARLVPVYWQDWSVVEKFWKENGQWAEKFLCRWEIPDAYQRRAVRSSRLLKLVKSAGAKVLDSTGLAGLLEKLSKKMQISRIDTNLPGRITANDQQLEFHPYSAEKDIVKKYNRTILKLGIFGGYQENDSGLR